MFYLLFLCVEKYSWILCRCGQQQSSVGLLTTKTPRWPAYVITRNRTTPSYSRRIATPPMFGSRPHKALAAANTHGIRESKCSPNVHWLSIMRPRYFILDNFPCHVYAQTGRRSPSPALIVESDGLRLRRGDPQAQSAHSTYRVGRCDFAEAQRLVPPATSDQTAWPECRPRNTPCLSLGAWDSEAPRCSRWISWFTESVPKPNPAEPRAQRATALLHPC